MVLKVFLIFSFLVNPEVHSAETVQLTSKDLRKWVESRNDRVKAKGLEKESAALREGSFGRSFLPKIELYGSQESFKKGTHDLKTQPTYGAEMSINLFNGGKDQLEENRRKVISLRKNFEKEQTLADQLMEAHSVYWEILYLRDHLAILSEADRTNANNLKAARRRIRSGVATQTDAVEFEMKDVELRQQRQILELRQKTQIQRLKILLGLQDSAELAFSEKLQHEHNYQPLIQHSEKDHEFLFKTAELQAAELELESLSEKRSYWPKLEAFAAWNQHNEREEEYSEAKDRQESVIGLKLSISLQDGFSARRESQALRARVQALNLEAGLQRKEIDLHLHSEMEELKLLHDQVHEAEENIVRSEKYYKLTQSEYSRGVKNSPDVLSASEKIYDMKVRRIDIIRQFQVSKFHLLAKLGK